MAVRDLDGAGAEAPLLPAAGRRKLRPISFAGGRFRELGAVEHRAAIGTDFQVRNRDGNGRVDVAYGRAIRQTRCGPSRMAPQSIQM